MQVLEEIGVGLELNDYAMQQQRLAHMRFLGELYNYECIDSSVGFETLNLIIVFGHGTSEVNFYSSKIGGDLSSVFLFNSFEFCLWNLEVLHFCSSHPDLFIFS